MDPSLIILDGHTHTESSSLVYGKWEVEASNESDSLTIFVLSPRDMTELYPSRIPELVGFRNLSSDGTYTLTARYFNKEETRRLIHRDFEYESLGLGFGGIYQFLSVWTDSERDALFDFCKEIDRTRTPIKIYPNNWSGKGDWSIVFFLEKMD